MVKTKLFFGVVFLSLVTLLASACAMPVPTPSPAPVSKTTGTVDVYVTDAPPRDEVTSIMVTVSRVEIHKAGARQEREQEQSGGGNQTRGQQQERKQEQSIGGNQTRGQQQERKQEQSNGGNQTQEQEQTQEGQGGWIAVDLSDNATTFDLLKIKGIEQYLGTNQVEAGKYTQVRLVVDKVEVALGDNEPKEATVPSGELKIVRHFNVIAGETTSIVLDFDADKSVTVTGAGKIIVKPVVKLAVRQEKPDREKGESKTQPETVEQASIEVSCDDFMEVHHISREVEAAVGETFTLILCSNPTTGFQWSESANISDQTVLEQVAHEFTPLRAKGNGPPAPGSAGQETWTFKALKEGETTISLDYSRPWEGGEKQEWTFTLAVVVK